MAVNAALWRTGLGDSPAAREFALLREQRVAVRQRVREADLREQRARRAQEEAALRARRARAEADALGHGDKGLQHLFEALDAANAEIDAASAELLAARDA